MNQVEKIVNWHVEAHPNFAGENYPLSSESIEAIEALSSKVLTQLEGALGKVTITYGFTSQKLLAYLKKNSPRDMGPELDQHAAHELNTRSNRICKRDGAACDIYVSGFESDMDKVADYIVNNIEFDRLYFYGKDRPLHISVGPDNAKYVLYRRRREDGLRVNVKSAQGDAVNCFFSDVKNIK